MNESTRILGIDYGTERVGIAVSDPLGIIATPLTTLASDGTLIAGLRDLVSKEGIAKIVVGMPLTLRGEEGVSAEKVREFIGRVKAEVMKDVVTVDERFTSTIANRTLRDMNTSKRSRREQKGRVDAMAAAIILQNYLDSIRTQKTCGPWT